MILLSCELYPEVKEFGRDLKMVGNFADVPVTDW